jgi:hypothetical protein
MSACERRVMVSASLTSGGWAIRSRVRDVIEIVCHRWGTMCCMNHTSVWSGAAAAGGPAGDAGPPLQAASIATRTIHGPSRPRTILLARHGVAARSDERPQQRLITVSAAAAGA